MMTLCGSGLSAPSYMDRNGGMSPMKKRAVLFLMVFCAILCFAFSVFDLGVEPIKSDDAAVTAFSNANSGDTVYSACPLKGKKIAIKAGVTGN